YSYDNSKRVTQIQRYPAPGNVEDMCQRTSLFYDTNTFDGSFSQNSMSRKTAEQWGGTTCSVPYQFTQMYSYTTGGLVTAKRLKSMNNSSQVASLTTSQSYTNEGRISSVTYPTAFDSNGNTLNGPTYTYTYDTLS